MTKSIQPPAHNVVGGLMAASRAHTAAVVARLAMRGYVDFPFSAASLLWMLDEGGTRSTLLAQRAGVTKQAMSQLVQLMERQGYLEQIADPHDTRAKVIKMTPRGEAVKSACMEVRTELNQQIAAAVGAEEARKMEGYLESMARMFGKDGPDAP